MGAWLSACGRTSLLFVLQQPVCGYLSFFFPLSFPAKLAKKMAKVNEPKL